MHENNECRREYAFFFQVVPFLVKKFKGEKPLELQEKEYRKDVVYLYQVRNLL